MNERETKRERKRDRPHSSPFFSTHTLVSIPPGRKRDIERGSKKINV